MALVLSDIQVSADPNGDPDIFVVTLSADPSFPIPISKSVLIDMLRGAEWKKIVEIQILIILIKSGLTPATATPAAMKSAIQASQLMISV